MRARVYFTAQSSATEAGCLHEHPTFAGAVRCAKKRGLDEVWSVELRREKRLRRAKTRVAS